jgi:hypothetical protein
VLSDHYYKALFVFDSGESRDTIADAGFRLRGNTSRYAQKKSFKISFNEYVPGRRYQGVKKLNLNGQHNDPTMIREKLFYNSWKKAGMAERRTSFVKLFINQVYFGLYTNLEEFDKDWLLRIYGENDGNLYKCTYPADLVYLGTNQQLYKDIESASATGGRAYDLQTNETEDDYTDLVNLISILNLPADSTFARMIDEVINVDGFLKAFAIDVASGNWDDYMYNKNNYFLYHRSDSDRFEFITYDTDNTFGVDWVNRDWSTRNCLDWYAHNQPRPLATKILSVPAFMEKYKLYLDTISRKIINPNIIFSHIDTLKKLIDEDAYADTYRTLDYGYTISDYNNGFTSTIDDHTPYGIKPFIIKRYTSTLQQLGTATTPEPVSAFDILLFPNPASGQLTIKVSPSGTDRKCQVIDIHGNRQLSFLLENRKSEFLLNLNNLKPGTYLLTIENEVQVSSKVFIKR